MKITADKKYFIFESQFDKLPAEIIDYIYIYVDNFVQNEKHKNFVKNDLLFFIKVYKFFNRGFHKIRFLSNNTVILNNRTKCDYQHIKDEKQFTFFIEESFKKNMILTSYEIKNYDVIFKDFLKKNIFSICKTIYDFKTILKKNYYYKNYNEMLKKPCLKKLNKLIKEKNNTQIFEMLEYSKLMDYIHCNTNFIKKDFFEVFDCITIDTDEYILFSNYYY
jgi:hypothetical protein